MGELQVEVEPAQVGLDADRLARLDRHFHHYVEDERLPGWLLVVSRHGQVAHVSTDGWRDRGRSLPVEVDTVWRLASMTKPITSVAAMMLYEEGAFELKDPVHRWLPEFRDMRVFRGGFGVQDGHTPGGGADPGVASAHPHRWSHLWLPVRPPGRRPLPGGRIRVGQPARPGPGRVLRTVGGIAPVVRAGDGVELLGGDRRARPAGGGDWPGSPSTSSFGPGSLIHLA